MLRKVKTEVILLFSHWDPSCGVDWGAWPGASSPNSPSPPVFPVPSAYHTAENEMEAAAYSLIVNQQLWGEGGSFKGFGWCWGNALAYLHCITSILLRWLAWGGRERVACWKCALENQAVLAKTLGQTWANRFVRFCARSVHGQYNGHFGRFPHG